MPTSLARRASSRLSIVFVLGSVLAGCGTSTTPTSPAGGNATEQAAITTVLASDPSFLDDGLLAAGTSTPAARAQPAGATAAIPPLTFWRTITQSRVALAWAFADSDANGRPRLADVTVTRRLAGTFSVLAQGADSTNGDSVRVVRKPLADTWVRHLRLRRLPTGSGDATVWRVVGASLADVTSDDATVAITSVRVQGPGCDTTLTDPAALWTLPRVRLFAPGDIVTITATTPRADAVVIGYWHDRRAPFQNQGDGTHVFDLHIGDGDGGWRWFAVNALTNGTLHDDAMPYDSKAWAFGCYVGARPDRQYY